MEPVCIPKSDLKFLFIATYVSMPMWFWFAFRIGKGIHAVVRGAR